MPDQEPLSFSSREGASESEGAEVQVCSGRRHPRVLVCSPSTSISSAVHHILETRRRVEVWSQQLDQDQDQQRSRLRLHDSAGDSAESVQLSVDGVAIAAREDSPSWPLLRKMEDVLGEVLHLVERLESDRQFALEALSRERSRKRLLECKLDSVSQRRRREHATAVQTGRHSGLQDIRNLQTQLKLQREKVLDVQQNRRDAEMLNQLVHKDIGWAKHQIPIVTGRLEVERGELRQVQTATAEAEAVFHKTQRDVTCSEENLREVKLDANKEKSSLDRILSAKKSHHAKKLDELQRLKTFEEGLCAEIKEDEGVAALTEGKRAAGSRHVPEMMEREKRERDSILFLKLQIEEEKQKNEALRTKLSSAEDDVERRRLTGDAHMALTRQRLESHRRTNRDLQTQNLQLQQNLDDHQTGTCQSENTVKRLRDERKQMLQRLSDNQQQFESRKQEVRQAELQHRLKLEELQLQQMEASREELNIQTHMESLRKDLSGQVTSQQLLKACCQALEQEVKQQQRSSGLLNQRLQEELQDQSRAAGRLQTKVQELRSLREHLEAVMSRHRTSSLLQEEQRRCSEERLRSARDLECELQERGELSLHRVAQLTEEGGERAEATEQLQRSIQQMQGDVEKLREQQENQEVKLSAARLLVQKICSQLADGKTQTRQLEKLRVAHVTKRRRRKDQTQEALVAALKQNQQLAGDYRRLQKILDQVQRDLVQDLSRKNQVQETCWYYRTLSGLQTRMSRTLVKNWTGPGLICGDELDLITQAEADAQSQ